jgi:hypothetical protein
LNPKEKPPENYSCSKHFLKKIITKDKFDDDNSIEITLFDAIDRTNKIVFHTYQFLKLYILHLYEKEKLLPRINVQLIRIIMNVLTIKTENRGSKSNKNNLTRNIDTFFKTHYKPLMVKEDFIDRNKLRSILNYEERTMIACVETNLKEHFMISLCESKRSLDSHRG